MKNLQHLLLFTLVFVLGGVVNAQDARFSQFWATPTTLNPALTGAFDGNIRGGLIYRSQWPSLESYNTTAISYEQSFLGGLSYDDRVSVGGYILNDVAGEIKLNTTIIMVGGALHKRLGEDTWLSLGVQVGLHQKKIDPLNLNFGDMFDGEDFNGQTAESINEPSLSGNDVNLGVSFTTGLGDKGTLNVGGAMLHILPPPESFFGDMDVTLASRIMLHGQLGYQLNDNVLLKPSLSVMSQANNIDISVGSALRYDISYNGKEAGLLLGTWFRVGDAVIPYVGMQYKEYTFGVNYDVTVSSLSDVNNGNGGFELSLTYTKKDPEKFSEIQVGAIRF